jgi:hypothetical protein
MFVNFFFDYIFLNSQEEIGTSQPASSSSTIITSKLRSTTTSYFVFLSITCIAGICTSVMDMPYTITITQTMVVTQTAAAMTPRDGESATSSVREGLVEAGVGEWTPDSAWSAPAVWSTPATPPAVWSEPVWTPPYRHGRRPRQSLRGPRPLQFRPRRL